MRLTRMPVHGDFDRESSQRIIGENVKVDPFDSRRHTHNYKLTHHRIITCWVLAFFMLAWWTIRGDITASITSATAQPSPHSQLNQLPTAIISMATGRRSVGTSVQMKSSLELQQTVLPARSRSSRGLLRRCADLHAATCCTWISWPVGGKVLTSSQ